MVADLNGFTQKEMLVRIDGKLDALTGRTASLELTQAVHEARPLHEEGQKNFDELRKDHLSLKNSFRYAAGAVSVIVIAGPFIFNWLQP